MQLPSPSERPAETSALAGAVAYLILYLLGVREPEVLLALTMVIAALPAMVTGLVERARRHR